MGLVSFRYPLLDMAGYRDNGWYKLGLDPGLARPYNMLLIMTSLDKLF